MEQARDAVLSEERLRPFARGYRAGIGPRAAPCWRVGGAWHDHAGPRRRKARARRLPQGARDQPAPRKGAGTGQELERKGRRPRYLTHPAARCDSRELTTIADNPM